MINYDPNDSTDSNEMRDAVESDIDPDSDSDERLKSTKPKEKGTLDSTSFPIGNQTVFP